jgi:hypothetical protein
MHTFSVHPDWLLRHAQTCPPDAGDTCPRHDNAHSGNFVSFACPPGRYNDLATIFFNTQVCGCSAWHVQTAVPAECLLCRRRPGHVELLAPACCWQTAVPHVVICIEAVSATSCANSSAFESAVVPNSDAPARTALLSSGLLSTGHALRTPAALETRPTADVLVLRGDGAVRNLSSHETPCQLTVSVSCSLWLLTDSAPSLQDDAIRNLFSSKTPREYSVSSLVTFTAVFFALSVISYGAALPTGLFVPRCGLSNYSSYLLFAFAGMLTPSGLHAPGVCMWAAW